MNCLQMCENVSSKITVGKGLLDGSILLFLLANIVMRLPVLFQYSLLLEVVVAGVLCCCFLFTVFPRYLKFFLFLFACSLPWYGSHSYLIYNTVFELFVAAVGLTLFVESRRRPRSDRPGNTLATMISCYMLLAFCSLLLMPVSHAASTLYLWGWQDFSAALVQATPESLLYPMIAVNRLLLFFVFIIQLSCHEEHDRLYRFIFCGLVTGAVMAAIVGIMEHYQLLSLDWYRETVFEGRRLQSVFGNAGWFAEYLSVTIPFILIGFLSPRMHTVSKLMLFGVLIICEVAILLTSSRTGWLIYPLVLCSCWLIFYISKRVEDGELNWRPIVKTVLKVAVSVPLTILISYFLVTGIMQHKDSDTANLVKERFSKLSNPAARKKIWQESMAMGGEAPLYGLGYESYKYQVMTLGAVPESEYSRTRQVKNIDYDTPHNFYFQVFISNGAMGLFFWSIIICYAVVLLLYDLKVRKEYFNIAVLLSIIAFHQYGVAQSMQYISVIWFLIFLSLGYIMSLKEAVLPEPVKKSARFAVVLLALLTVVGAVVYAGNFESRSRVAQYGLRLYGPDQELVNYFGFYNREDWGEKGIFRWTGKRAVIELDRGGSAEFDYTCPAPGLAGNPIVLNVLIDGELVDRISFSDGRMVTRRYAIRPQGQGGDRQVEFRVSRTWNPRQIGLRNDYRNLGVAVSGPRFL